MSIVDWVNQASLGTMFFGTIVVIFFSIGAGTALRKLVGVPSTESDSTGSVVGATLGLLAFIMAFSFNMAANRLDARKQLFLDEINTIEATWLRSGMLASPYSAQVKAHLQEYVLLRLEAAEDPSRLPQAIRRSEEIHAQLWEMVEQISRQQKLTIAESLFIQSLNSLIDLHAKRVVVALKYRIPETIWAGLYAIAILAMLAVGFQFGKSSKRQHVVNIMLAGAFSAVITLIADLDRAAEGSVKVSQQPLQELYRKFEARERAIQSVSTTPLIRQGFGELLQPHIES